MQTLSQTLSQGERLELANVGTQDDALTVTFNPAPPWAKPAGWQMPSAEAVRLHDARLAASDHHAPPMGEDESDDDDDSEETALRDAAAYKRRDSLREHSFRLPSQSSRRECLGEMRALGLSWEGGAE